MARPFTNTLIKKINVIFLTAVFLCSAVYGQTKLAAGSDEPSYKDLVSKAKAGDTSVDFKAMRIAYSNTKVYSPYGGDRKGRTAVFASLDKKNYKE